MIHIDWKNPPDLTAERANIPKLLDAVEALWESVREYEAWIDETGCSPLGGYASLNQAERRLDAIQRRTHPVLDWVLACKEWKKRVTTLDPAVYGMVQTLDEICIAVLETVRMVNDPTIQRPDDPGSVFIAPGTKPAHIPAVNVAQLKEATDTLRSWLPQIAGPNPPATPPGQGEGDAGKSKQPGNGSSNNPRDKFIYENMAKGKGRAWIKNHFKKSWEPLESEQAVSAAAKRYAERHRLPWPINKQTRGRRTPSGQ